MDCGRRSRVPPVALLLAVAVVATALAGCAPGPRAAAPTAVPGVPTGPHPAPHLVAFRGCPAEGRGGDPDLNRLKNRDDSVQWQPTTVEAILSLPQPNGLAREHMARWSASVHADVDPYNGVPVQAEGYLLGVRAQGAESTNCSSTVDVDFHLWLAGHAADDRSKSVVTEITPRLRAQHPNWTVPDLEPLVRQGRRVRVSGWLFFDPEHPDQVGKTRGTLWEIHPVMQLEGVQ